MADLVTGTGNVGRPAAAATAQHGDSMETHTCIDTDGSTQQGDGA
jgi:hypothetical protein